MQILDIIIAKRDGRELSREEIDFFVREYGAGNIPDYQASALLMAVYLNKMNPRETTDLALAMAASGEKISYEGIPGIRVDKHSSGGVGDKTTLIVGPMTAACGLSVAKMSGRGLGFSGGTIDKLESIPGFRTSLSREEFVRLVRENGIAIMGQTQNVAPVDKKLYALRDVTGTVENLSLIASSIMSKKLACDSDAIVLDVKAGSGAFMKSVEEAVELAGEMVFIGALAGKKIVAAVTDMDEPLGYAVGNALEVKEAIHTLKGEGPADLTELCLVIGSLMLELGEIAPDRDTARKMLEGVLLDGSAYEKFLSFVCNQGGDVSVIKDESLLPAAKMQLPVPAAQDGFVSRIDAQKVGEASLMVGAGRHRQDDVPDLSVGVVLAKKVGDRVGKGETLCTVHCNDKISGEQAVEWLRGGFEIGETAAVRPMLHALVTPKEVIRFD